MKKLQSTTKYWFCCYVCYALTNVKTGISVQLPQLPRGRRWDTGTTIYYERRPLLVPRKINVIYYRNPFLTWDRTNIFLYVIFNKKFVPEAKDRYWILFRLYLLLRQNIQTRINIYWIRSSNIPLYRISVGNSVEYPNVSLNTCMKL